MASYYGRGSKDDTFVGRKGDDTMSGNDGNDTLYGMGGNDNLYGGNGNDRLYGGDGNDFLQGNAGDDLEVGGTGRDILYSGQGADILWGGSEGATTGDGAVDYFVYNYQNDSRDGYGIDRIMDFHPEEGDVINIARTAEGTPVWPDDARVQLVSDLAQLNHNHQQATLTYDPATGYTTLNLYYGDGNADIDMTVLIAGEHTTIDGFLDFYI